MLLEKAVKHLSSTIECEIERPTDSIKPAQLWHELFDMIICGFLSFQRLTVEGDGNLALSVPLLH